MDQMTYKGVLLSFSILIGLGLAAPALASGDYYVNADSAAKSDDNACLSKSAPCATLGGVIGQILASAHPEDSTIYAKGNFDEQLDISDSALEGLTVTWLEQGVHPVINGVGLNYGVSVYQVDGVSLKHLNVIGSNYASIYVNGGSSSHIRGVNIENCTVESADADATSHNLKSSSLAIEAGMSSLDFDEDDEMNQRLLKDWDNDPRPTFSSPDVGADEVTEL